VRSSAARASGELPYPAAILRISVVGARAEAAISPPWIDTELMGPARIEDLRQARAAEAAPDGAVRSEGEPIQEAANSPGFVSKGGGRFVGAVALGVCGTPASLDTLRQAAHRWSRPGTRIAPRQAQQWRFGPPSSAWRYPDILIVLVLDEAPPAACGLCERFEG